MGLALDEPKENEVPVQVNGISVLIADLARPFVEDTTVDYVNGPRTEGFSITRSGDSC